ncbi:MULTISPECIES: bifunctional tetrahydrofolate synthase/dihydrofolate synthase [Pasteurellaceae]|uniref:bifunctional tetrahydrofolate synthase/dihydrofolate synthase n=1 Tax=Pasteurellaceae TaxID=712 RepID=UPI00356AFED1
MNNPNSRLTAISPLQEWLSYLEHSHFKTIDLGLARITAVARALDLLHPAPFVITVGGTNGKGTTCRLLETVLLNAGYRVGVYSSPHLIRYNERVRIQNRELDDAAHCRSFAFIERHKTESLTYFEFSTLSALHLFKQAALDVVILEVGLGGRLDATNIVDSNIALITSIDIDHTDFLGSTREQIGFEKAGIFRAGKPVIIGEPDIPASMLEQAHRLGCPLSCRDQDWRFTLQGESWCWQDKKVRWENLPFPQIPVANAATALAAIGHLPFAISPAHIRQALSQVELTGRFQTLAAENRQMLAKSVAKPPAALPRVIIDVGHNPHAARYLAQKLTALHAETDGRIIAVCGILKDKDAAGVVAPLLSLIDYWYCVSLDGERGQRGEALFVTLQQTAQSQQQPVAGESADSVAQGVKRALEHAQPKDTVLIFGSFHTVGAFLAMR